MKSSIFLALILVLYSSTLVGQKKAIDFAAYNNWERLEEINGRSCIISANGKFVLYRKVSSISGAIAVLENIGSGQKKQFAKASNEKALNNDKLFAFQSGRDTLVIFNTETGQSKYLPGIQSYFIISTKSGDRIGQLIETSGKKSLVVSDIEGNVIWRFQNVSDITFNEENTEGVYFRNAVNGISLNYINLLTGENRMLLDSDSEQMKSRWKIESYGLAFNKDNVLFQASRLTDLPSVKSNSVISSDVNIWSYKDLYLNDRQMSELNKRKTSTWLFSLKNKKLVEMESDSIEISTTGNSDKYFVMTSPVNENEFYWNKQKMRLYLFSVETGASRLIIESDSPGFSVVGISPDNKYLVWFNGSDHNYYSYDIVSHKSYVISERTGGVLSTYQQSGESAKSINGHHPFVGQMWINNGKNLIVHANNDIFQLDASGIKDPINLTNGFGDRQDIRFRMLEKGSFRTTVSPLEIKKNEYLVWAFDNRTKQNGFWKIRIGKAEDPVRMVMTDDTYYFVYQSGISSASPEEDPSRFAPIKALKANVFVFRKMNSSSLPNLYATTDFKNFKNLSELKINKDYINVKTKLISYRSPGGKVTEGILHLPGNLDTIKKYPIIFNYYERRSETLNIRRIPELSGHNINIPWYVSRGYLVFEPDFYYERGKTAVSIIECVKSAISELAKLPYVDTAKMGAQGQSFGGYETNVLAVQTNLFKAACEMAGYSNLITEYGSVRPNGVNNQIAADIHQRNLGVFPWEHPEVFIESSPVLHVGKMNTPLLIVHNKGDGAVSFSHAVELYLAGRRLNKRIWLLEYEGEGHTINKEENKLDFTIRMQQFFDHYLKGAPAPRWMTRGIPAAMKGIDSGLGLDTEIKTPGEGIARPVEKGKIF